MRTFVAIPLSEPIREALGKAQQELGSCGVEVKWVKPPQIHLTLKFLGDVSDVQVEQLSQALRQTATGFSALTLGVHALGSFPEHGAPRVLWAGIVTPDLSHLQKLVASVDVCAIGIGIAKEDRPFVPHLTLGRLKSAKGAERLKAAMMRFAQHSFGVQTVEYFELIQSTLTPAGPIYTTLERFVLGKG